MTRAVVDRPELAVVARATIGDRDHTGAWLPSLNDTRAAVVGLKSSHCERHSAGSRGTNRLTAIYRQRQRRLLPRVRVARAARAAQFEYRAVAVLPPAGVVPKRSPAASAIRPAIGVPRWCRRS